MKGNCLTGCKHCLVRDIIKVHQTQFKDVVVRRDEIVGYERYCDKSPDVYADWRERNKNNTYEVYKNDFNECYEPTESAEALNKMIEISNDILDKLKV